MGFRSTLYKMARIMGDVSAIQNGPQAIGKRIVRKSAYRAGNKVIGKSLRKIGLF